MIFSFLKDAIRNIVNRQSKSNYNTVSRTEGNYCIHVPNLPKPIKIELFGNYSANNSSRSCSSCAPLVWNQGFPTPPGESSISIKPVMAPDIRFSFSQFRKQQQCHENSVSRTCVAVVVCTWSCESIWRGRADSPHSRPYEGVWRQFSCYLSFDIYKL
ncbi:unnamed protein product [Schistosoma curassoni]|uniref:Uncharacterized protein n=1 Tax=Schistosoma curassoni TaxID=6186 RepID=A0A3P8C0P4_9TREM|nr:unnamed protein product [Schistosoma curassoni]